MHTEGENSSPVTYRPNIEALLAAVAQTESLEAAAAAGDTVRTGGMENCRSSTGVNGVDDSQLIGVHVEFRRDSLAAPEGEAVVQKRKRGRPPKGTVTSPKPPPPKRSKEEEEDVCFICFDGGSLVLCDRKGCPKAYHPACIKRDEAFFRSKAKWNCGWHICSVCQKASHYMCYTCTYSLCKGCTKDQDYVCVRGNKGFCTTCMKTIMLIENKDQANNEQVQVDFDDKTSWEYLFKVYWVCLKEKLSLTLNELIHAKNPWKGVSTNVPRTQLPYVHQVAQAGKVSISDRLPEHLEINKPKEQLGLLPKDPLSTENPRMDKHIENVGTGKGTGDQSIKNSTDEESTNKGTDEQSTNTVTNEQSTNKAADKACANKSTEWASKDLLEFVAHMKNGDTSILSPLDVQALLLEYIKRNNLRDPHKKSQIICDLRLKNLFGIPRVGHIEMLKLLEYHFLIKEDAENNAFIPAGFVGPIASHVGADYCNQDASVRFRSRKRKTRGKVEERAPQTNLDEYAAIDVHNINLIYLRRNLMENLIEDKAKFHDKVVGSIVRIRISANDQKQDLYRLVQVVGTTGVSVPYKIGERTADVMLEVLNLDKKESISIDAVSNQEFSEDECRRLRQSIKCGLVKRWNVGEIQKKAMELQAVRLNDRLKAEILKLNHLRDRASEKGHKKELRECVEKLQLLETPEERQRLLCEVPEIHTDPKMNPNYESQEDAGNGVHKKNEDECKREPYPGFGRKGREPISPKSREEGATTRAQNRAIIDSSESNGVENRTSHVSSIDLAVGCSNTAAMVSGSEALAAESLTEKPQSSSNSETEKIWHYRDPSGTIQGPFSMFQLRKWSPTGFFPSDMRIWTNHEQYDSVYLADAMNREVDGIKDLPCNISSHSQDPGALSGINLNECAPGGNETMSGKGRDSRETETAGDHNNASRLSTSNKDFVKEDGSGSSSWPQCWDLLNDNNSDAEKLQLCSSSPSSHPGPTSLAVSHQCPESVMPDSGPPHADKSSTEFREHHLASEGGLRNQPDDLNGSGQSCHNIDLGSDFGPVTKSIDLSENGHNIDLKDLPRPTPETSNKDWGVEMDQNHKSLSSDISVKNPDILELLSPNPRPATEDLEGQSGEMKNQGAENFPVVNSGPGWSGASALLVNGVQLPDIAEEWCRYSPTSAKPNNNQITLSSPSHPTSNISNWQSIDNEPIEFDALGEESVSDLLAELESQSGCLPSPTSAMKCGKEIPDCKDDCFSSIEEFSRTPDPGKSDALSSTNLELSGQSSVACKPVGASHGDVFDFFRRSAGQSSTSSEGETKSVDAPVYPAESGSDFNPPASSNLNQEMVGTSAGAMNVTSDATDSSWGNVQGPINLVTVQGNVNLVLGGTPPNLGWGSGPGPGPGPGPAWANQNMNRHTPNNTLPWDNQRKYGNERFNGHRDWSYQGGEPGFGRGRPSWGRQPYGSGGYSRPPPKGHRVCKFYESGRCKKGAFCDYLHP